MTPTKKFLYDPTTKAETPVLSGSSLSLYYFNLFPIKVTGYPEFLGSRTLIQNLFVMQHVSSDPSISGISGFNLLKV